MLIELLTDIDLLSDADNDPLVLIESLTISEVLIESDVLVETLCDAAMLSDPETEPLVLVESLNDSDVLIDLNHLYLMILMYFVNLICLLTHFESWLCYLKY